MFENKCVLLFLVMLPKCIHWWCVNGKADDDRCLCVLGPFMALKQSFRIHTHTHTHAPARAFCIINKKESALQELQLRVLIWGGETHQPTNYCCLSIWAKALNLKVTWLMWVGKIATLKQATVFRINKSFCLSPKSILIHGSIAVQNITWNRE